MLAVGNGKLIEVGSNIRKWRDLKGMKQESLAEELDISAAALSKIETGKTDIPLTRLFAIATVLDIDVQLLFSDPCNMISKMKNINEYRNTVNFLSLKNIKLIVKFHKPEKMVSVKSF